MEFVGIINAHHSKDDNTLIGRFCFIERGKEDAVETGIYLVKSAQKKGYGQEETIAKPLTFLKTGKKE